MTASGAFAGAPAAPAVRLELPPAAHVASWGPDSDNRRTVTGRLLLGGAPVQGATVTIDGVRLPPTDAAGRFSGAVDATVPARHAIRVQSARDARVGGRRPSGHEVDALLAAAGSVDVADAVTGLTARRTADGILVTGTIGRPDGTPVPTVRIFSYRLEGRILDAKGKPVAGAVVSTRTLDRDYWTVSEPSGKDGRYVSLFTASDEAGADPVSFSVRVAVGDALYEFLPDESISFRRLQSAVLDLRLPPPGYAMAIPHSTSRPGAVYQGVLVGASAGGRPLRPLRVTWPDARGRFTLLLPAALSGRTVELFEGLKPYYSSFPAVPGGRFDLASLPAALDPTWPAAVPLLRLP